MEINDKRGSIWRKWDLHVHPPEVSFGGDYIQYISNLSKSEAEVIGINDYCSIEGYKKIVDKGGIPDKVFFPVVELRMNNIIGNRKNKATESGVRINFHLIFDNNPEILPKINNWLNSLDCFNEFGANDQLGNIEKQKLDKITFDFEKTIESLIKVGLRKNTLIWLPYDEYGGIDDIDPKDNFFKLALIKKSDIIGSSTQNQIKYFGWQDEKFSIEQYKKWFDRPMPCIKGSDSHKINYPFGKLLDKESKPTNKYCWIKSDKTFDGLKQIIVEPERVFIGEIPPSKQRVEQNKTKYIKELTFKKIKESTLDETWFENIEPIQLNTDLVAIIGNKGNGKSAIADILGLLGNTKNHGGFSFLNKEKFRKLRPNRSESFQASIEWENGTKDGPVFLSTNPEGSLPEKVKYIPQSYLEKLCTETDEAKFSEELKNVIFSHVDASEKLGKYSLDELIEYKSEEINKGIQSLINELSEINNSIEGLEAKSTPEYRAQQENALKLKKEEQKEHKKTKPEKIKEPKKDPSLQQEQTKITKKVEELKEKQKEIEIILAEKKEQRKNHALKLAKLQKFEQSADNLKQQYDKLKEQYSEDLSEYDIKFEQIIKLTVSKKTIDVNIADTKKLIENIDIELNNQIEGSLSFNYSKNQKELKDLQSKLDEPTRKYQEYLDKLKEWEDKDKGLIGTEEQQGSIKFHESILKYLDEKLNIEISEDKQKRKILVKQIFKEKSKIVELYKELYSPVTRFIGEYRQLMKEYPINLDVSIQLDNFHEKFFGFISRGSKGSFIGTEEGYVTLSEVTEGVDFNNEESVFNFLDEIISLLGNDKRTEKNDKRRISDQLKQGFEVKSFYDFLFSLDYLKPNYKLKLGSKNLSELSPGERGALLLIFYLLLDKQDIPLIIDQPEENLDNQSVYTVLVKFIKEAKKKRQIIIVTHNPNLAVVCDAEQIIYVKIQKENKNKVVVKSGAIEHPEINSKIVEILEGTFPAFENRSDKYRISR